MEKGLVKNKIKFMQRKTMLRVVGVDPNIKVSILDRLIPGPNQPFPERRMYLRGSLERYSSCD